MANTSIFSDILDTYLVQNYRVSDYYRAIILCCFLPTQRSIVIGDSTLNRTRIRNSLNLRALTEMVAPSFFSFFRLRLVSYFLTQPLHDWSQRNTSPGDVLGMFWGCFGDAPKHPQNIPKTSPRHPQDIPNLGDVPKTSPKHPQL